jgi:DNA-binding IclR family transcriptional regulator
MVSDKLLKATIERMSVGSTMTLPELEKETGKYGSNLRRILQALEDLRLVDRIDIDEPGSKGHRLQVGYVRRI